MAERLIIGAMSGTSADGVDVALVRIDGTGLSMTANLLYHQHRAFADDLRKVIFEVRSSGQASLKTLAGLARDITHTYAAAVRDLLLPAGFRAAEIAAVAAHGQTLFHDPPATIQWLDPALLAWETGCTVVSDFRRADCAAGGQGAPLVPFADYILFRHPRKNRVLLNIGGIANLTYLRAGGDPGEVIAFDTGPGNCISDEVCRELGSFGVSWDIDGRGAAIGRVESRIADRFLADPYFTRTPPKSTDTPAMLALFDEAVADEQLPMNDLLATAARITGVSIASSIRSLGTGENLEIFVSGGGYHNKTIMGWIRATLGNGVDLSPTHRLGVNPDAKEAVAFALLAAATLDGVPSNLPSVTGATQSVILGSITPKPTSNAAKARTFNP